MPGGKEATAILAGRWHRCYLGSAQEYVPVSGRRGARLKGAGRASGTDRFNLYRGRVRWLADGVGASCLAADLESNTATDPETPWPGTAWYYLVTGESSGGEGTRGNYSTGVPRIALPACF